MHAVLGDAAVDSAAGFATFLTAWQAWRQSAPRCRRLIFVGIAAHANAPTAADLRPLQRALLQTDGVAALAAELIAAWPPTTANVHRLAFDGGSVQLLLGWGAVERLLREMRMRADALMLDGLPPERSRLAPDQRLLKAFSRHTAPDATVVALVPPAKAQWTCAGLTTAGFDVRLAAVETDGTPQTVVAGAFRPRFVSSSSALALSPAATSGRHAVVIGAGLAGAFTAVALADEGWTVSVLDRHALPAQGTSGQAGGIFHGTLHADDGRHARLLRAAALTAERTLRPLIDSASVPGQLRGLLRLEARGRDAMQRLIDCQRQPADWVQTVDRAAASALAGVALPIDAWLYPGGGWVAPAALVGHLLGAPGVRYTGGQAVRALRATARGWQALAADDSVIAQGDVAVVASGADAQQLLAPFFEQVPLRRSRGQSSGWSGPPSGLLMPVAGDGYALPLPGGGVLCGASSSDDDGACSSDDTLRPGDHQANFERLHRLTGLRPPADAGLWIGRVGWRLQTDDRLPMAGPVPSQPLGGATRRLDQPRWWPRVPGLYVLRRSGSRGITVAPLLGRLLAAQIAGSPWPLESPLVDAVDPARWLVRDVRQRW